jgi:U3 small nucleolar RNA-associated protein 24
MLRIPLQLGPKYRLALKLARDPQFDRVTCDHKGYEPSPFPFSRRENRQLTTHPPSRSVYADDCIVDRVMKHRIYIVATNDRDLKRRIRRITGVPIMSVARGKYVIERLPGAPV